MIPLTKTHFVSTIEAIRQQLCKDIAYADAVSSIYNTDSIGPYDNSLLVKQLISHLQLFFPKDEKGFCEIEHYCFDMNFGKIGDQELITAEDLWDRLTIKKFGKSRRLYKIDWSQLIPGSHFKEPIVSTHPLIDDNDDFSKHFLSDLILSEFISNALSDKSFGKGKILAFEAIENELKKK